MDKDYYCPHCKKQYSSYKSLWNHNKKFEEQHRIIMNHKNAQLNHISSIKNHKESSNQPHQYSCKYCNKNFKTSSNKLRHERGYCKTKQEIEKEEQRKLQQQQMMEERKLQQQQMMEELKLAKEDTRKAREEARIRKEINEETRLKIRLENAKKKANTKSKPSIQRINQQLKQHNEIKNSTVNSHNNITNNNLTIENQHQHQHNHNNLTIENQQIIQNYQIIQVGKEQDISLLLTNQEKMTILNSRRFALQKITEILHGGNGKYKQFKSLIVTNLRNKYIYKYDDTKKEFIAATMEDVMAILVDNRLSDLETIYDQNTHKISDITKKSLERFINEMREPGSDSRRLEIEQIKMLLFNDRDKIMMDIEDEISLVLTVVEVPNEA